VLVGRAHRRSARGVLARAAVSRRARAANGHLVLTHRDRVQPKESVMPIQSRYLFTAAMDVEPSKDAIFNEVYDMEHVPALLQVPGVVSVARFRRRPLEMFIGGERKKIVIEGEPSYTALYELESPEVLVTPAWSAAVERGRWPAQVRPYTSNRRHFMWQKI
jgi:hypothetical protein